MHLTYDPEEAVAALSKSDRQLARVIRKAGPFTHRPPRGQSPFHSLLEAIVYQQLTGKAAATIFGRVAALYPGRGGPTAAALLKTRDEKLRAAGLSRGKVLAVKDLAAKTLEGVVPALAKLKRMPDDEILERLVEVRGVGPWTVEMLLIFRLGRPDVLPASDYGVRNGFKLTYRTKDLPGPKAILAHGERWRPYRSVAAWYLWRAVDLEREKTKNGKMILPG
jgi:3-methyladenine DNA glycosylase/8-oxoguanine DNA glycosylase